MADDPELMATVLRVREEAGSAHGTARRLNEMGVVNPSGCRWHTTLVLRMVKRGTNPVAETPRLSPEALTLIAGPRKPRKPLNGQPLTK